MPSARRHLIALSSAVCWLAASPATATAEARATIDIEGSWYVLIYYRDQSTAHPERLHWLDLAWRFEPKGTRLEWAEYPLVVFDDQSGRFEAVGGNPRSRVLGAWEPNPGQRAEIRAGPRVNSRGSKVKTLKGSPEEGWRSSRRKAQTAATVLTYHESVTIEGLDALPLFLREDSLGNMTNLGNEGATRYQVTEVRNGGDLLAGEYTRDDKRHGSFRMWRTKPIRGLKKKKGTPNERAAERAREAYLEQLEKELGP